MKVKSESEVAQSCPTLSDPMDCSLLGSSIHRIFQARVLEWGAIDLLVPHNINNMVLQHLSSRSKLGFRQDNARMNIVNSINMSQQSPCENENPVLRASSSTWDS